MLASPLVTCCCAHEKSRNGTTQNDTASTVMCIQTRSARGSGSRRSTTKSPRVSPPRMSLDQATCAGEIPVRATFMNRKLDPHTIPHRMNCTAIVPFDSPVDATGICCGAVEVTRRL